MIGVEYKPAELQRKCLMSQLMGSTEVTGSVGCTFENKSAKEFWNESPGWVISNHVEYLRSGMSYPYSYLLSNWTNSSGINVLSPRDSAE